MIQLRNFSFSYGARETPNLNRVNIQVESGQFVLVCGATGSGKSTLLKCLVGLLPHFSGGKVTGTRLIDGIDHTESLPHDTAALIGFVNQQPEGSFVAETVIEEVAFTLEQLGVAPEQMWEKIDRALELTSLSELKNRKVTELSGGQQQRVAIAAALSAGQRILILDEPTSALDPATAHELLDFVHKLCKTEGMTAIIAEHRIERLIDLVDSVIVVSPDGSVDQGSPRVQLSRFEFVPPLIKLGQLLGWKPIALSVAEAKAKLAADIKFKSLRKPALGELVISTTNLSHAYGATVALDDVSISASQGEAIAIMGENGSGKTTLLWKLREIVSDCAMVPQQASDLLFLNSIGEELSDSDEIAGAPSGATASLFENLAGRIDPKIHPRDLSSGQQLALVLAMQLTKPARVVLLDEPTRGLDYSSKQQVASMIHKLKAAGKLVIFASHDVEFVALAADRVIQLDQGKVASDSSVADALSHKGGLATQVAMVFETQGLITLEQVIADE